MDGSTRSTSPAAYETERHGPHATQPFGRRAHTKLQRVKVIVHGAVQGVGFRPFVQRIATELDLRGWVMNSTQGVFIEVEGTPEPVEQFLLRLGRDTPLRAMVHGMEATHLEPIGYSTFQIRESETGGEKAAFIMPDLATCPDCLREILDPSDRRHLYAFTSCVNCGPRYSIIEDLPYDRAHTSMSGFKMCAKCEAEYHDPRNRRFHAHANACPNCGPQLALWDDTGEVLARRHDAVLGAAAALRAGRIIALKGVGGFQLLVDARNEDAIRRLRVRKHRDEKPFALLFPYLDSVRRDCEVNALEERLLHSPESPIVILQRRHGGKSGGKKAPQLDGTIAPGNSTFGVMLPCSPLHHLLMRETGFPVVATSGNVSDEPICIDERVALERLHGIADLFLVHNRPIVRHVDDSVARIIMGREQVLRRARGYAPLPIHVKDPLPHVLAVGAHSKNTVALSIGREVVLSQHIGDLDTQPAYNAFRRVCGDLQRLYDATPDVVACDMHPDRLSTKFARSLNTPLAWVQHHYAHVISCMTENEVEAPALGIAWDGAGYATDGTVWGSESLLVDETSFRRVAHFRPFKLPGAEAAAKQPRYAALGVLHEIYGNKIFDPHDNPLSQHFNDSETPALRDMLNDKGPQVPVTTSAGRLFDAVASLLNLRQQVNYEGQAAMLLENLADRAVDTAYPFKLGSSEPCVLDWEPMIRAIQKDLRDQRPTAHIAAQFHNTLAAMILAVAKRYGEHRVVLSGGCFENRYLTERTVTLLDENGFRPFWHQRVPTNDGGIALGQVLAAVRASHHSTPLTEHEAYAS